MYDPHLTPTPLLRLKNMKKGIKPPKKAKIALIGAKTTKMGLKPLKRA